MTSRKPLAIAGALGSVAGLALAIQVRAGGDKVAFPEDYAAGILYGTVDRYDVKQYREQYATPAAVEAVRKGQPIPSGTVITMLEYKAQVDAEGKPIKDANDHFVKGDLNGYNVMEKRTGWAPSTRTISATANGSTSRSPQTERSTTRPISLRASIATNHMRTRTS
jgi:Cytochrome P460